ncbi:MAG: 2OG-Fe(II) oxygenase [Deltaproteobacteria bacterium]|nr:2OG-Fe(II) oxygenase [Deltaproteobacteria bacterium]
MLEASIPVIDFSQDLPTVAQEVKNAYMSIGFMYVKNLLTEFELRDQVFAEARRFFELPQAEKERCGWTSEASNRGYTAVERENVDPTAPGDLKEAYNMGCEGNPEHPNPWPEGLPSFQEAMQTFYEACVCMSERVLEAFEVGLELPTGFLQERHELGESNIMRVLHYPTLQNPDAVKSGQLRAGAHTDYGTHTLLLQDDTEGLEVQNRDGEWVAAPSIPDTVLVNGGDLLARWTNDVFCSTPHRVVLPQDQKQNQSRYSLVFFCHPNYHAEIRCLESCQTPGNPARYPPIGSGEYLLWRLSQSY